MNDLNFNALTGLLISLVSLAALLYVAYKQTFEVLRPKNWLTGLRWQIYALLIISIVGLIPAITYQFCRVIHVQAEFLRSVATVTGALSRLGNAVLLVMVFNYRKKN